MDDTAERINERVCKTAEEFNALCDAFCDKLVPREVTLLQKKIALDALARIVSKNPVRKPPKPGEPSHGGRSRGNWQVTIGVAAENELDVLDKIGTDTIAKGVSALADLGGYQVVFISNNVPYIIYLEDGSSDQAPHGMVQLTFEELKATFE